MKPVLYVEDDESDATLMQCVFADVGVQNPLRIVPDGKTAIAYLARTGSFSDAIANPTPCLVLLDLRLQDQKEIDVIQWIRGQPSLVDIPIVVLTASNQKTDIHRSYLVGASGFFVKPNDPDELAEVIRALKEQWLDRFSERKAFREISAFRTPEDGQKKSRDTSAPGFNRT